MKQHVVMVWKDAEITMKPGTSGAKTKINGVPLTGERVMKHLDRVLFGGLYFTHSTNFRHSVCISLLLRNLSLFLRSHVLFEIRQHCWYYIACYVSQILHAKTI